MIDLGGSLTVETRIFEYYNFKQTPGLTQFILALSLEPMRK